MLCSSGFSFHTLYYDKQSWDMIQPPRALHSNFNHLAKCLTSTSLLKGRSHTCFLLQVCLSKFVWPFSGQQALKREEECQTFMWSITNLNERKHFSFVDSFFFALTFFISLHCVSLLYLHFCLLSHFKSERIRCIMKLLITSSMCFLLKCSWKNKTWNAKCAPPLFWGLSLLPSFPKSWAWRDLSF